VDVNNKDTKDVKPKEKQNEAPKFGFHKEDKKKEEVKHEEKKSEPKKEQPKVEEPKKEKLKEEIKPENNEGPVDANSCNFKLKSYISSWRRMGQTNL
jgi:hypothetical protein